MQGLALRLLRFLLAAFQRLKTACLAFGKSNGASSLLQPLLGLLKSLYRFWQRFIGSSPRPPNNGKTIHQASAPTGAPTIAYSNEPPRPPSPIPSVILRRPTEDHTNLPALLIQGNDTGYSTAPPSPRSPSRVSSLQPQSETAYSADADGAEAQLQGSFRLGPIAAPSHEICQPPLNEDRISVIGARTPSEKITPIITRYLHRFDKKLDILRSYSISGHDDDEEEEEEKLPPGWVMNTHPDGQRIFAYNSGVHRYLTLEDIYNPSVYEEISAFKDDMQSLIYENGYGSKKLEIVLDLFQGSWRYYLVDDKEKIIMWVHPIDRNEMVLGAKIASNAHFDIAKRAEYWQHTEWFPHERDVCKNTLDELAAVLLHGNVDTMTSLDSTMPYTADQLRQMFASVNTMRCMRKEDHENPYMKVAITANVGRLMSLILQTRFFNYHGQHCARLSRDQPVGKHTGDKRTWLLAIASPLLFYAPDTHHRSLRQIWVDEIITQRPWMDFVATLKEEWVDFILNATVVLNANVSLLQVLGGQDGAGGNTVAMFASLCSIVTSIGCVMVGLLLVRQYRSQAKETFTAAMAVDYLKQRQSERFGEEPLAIIYSLPYALLMWSMVSFLAAIAAYTFVSKEPQQIGLSIVWFCVAFLVLWTVRMGWEHTEFSRVQLALEWVKNTAGVGGKHFIRVPLRRQQTIASSASSLRRAGSTPTSLGKDSERGGGLRTVRRSLGRILSLRK